jgi:hypothetical protein
MTAPMPDGQPSPGADASLSEAFEVFVSETLPDGVMEVIEAVQELTTSPLEQAQEHFEAVNELQLQSVEALMNNDPDTAQALLAEADGHLRDGADVLDDAD